MTIAVQIEKELTYQQYLGISTLLMSYPRLTAYCYQAKGKYLDALKKMKGIVFMERDDAPPLIPDDTFIVKTNSLTLGRWIDLPKNEVVMDDGKLLMTEADDVFKSQKIAHIINIPEIGLTPENIARDKKVYSILIRTILPDRIWNFYNETVWGLSEEKPLGVNKDKKVFRFHILGLHHLPTSREYMSCAFTQKNVKLCQMLMDLGHEVYLYGAEGSDAPCTKLIQTHSLKDIRDSWGEGDNRFAIGYDWKSNQFKHDINTEPALATIKARQVAIEEINKNKRDDDFLIVTQGYYQKPIADAVKLKLTVEPGIGYRGSFAQFRAFESTYIQNFTYGSEHPRQSINGNYYDRVIPNYFDEKDFPVCTQKGNYYLFMGRLIIRKGLETAIKTVSAIGGKLVVAGQRDPETEQIMKNPVVEYIGYADPKKRAELMGRAKAVFCPSLYLEPFCGVHAEAMLCGTPVITTNFGAFTDYVIDGLNGYKCNVLNDFVKAAKEVEKLDPLVIKRSAVKFTLNSVKWEYQRWFQDLHRLYESTIDSTKKAWYYLD